MPSWAAELVPLAALVVLPWLTFWDVLTYGRNPQSPGPWVSDDILGISVYNGKLQRPVSWHNCFKWWRWHTARIPNPNRDWQRKNLPSHLPSPQAHHRLNLWFHSAVLGLLYLWLRQVLPQPVALLTTILWAVHPLGGQTVAWISGIGYVASTAFMLLGLNVVWMAGSQSWLATPLGALGSFVLFGFCQWMAVECQFATAGVVLLLLLLNQWPFAILAGIIAIYGSLNTLREAITLRKAVFKEQQMATSTRFHFKKIIVVLKTLAYSLKLAVFPKRLGLYHTFCYHYELPYVETEDWSAVAGIGCLIGFSAGIAFGPLPLQLACLWFLAFHLPFFNWITANQFVVDRYTWMPSLGMCLLAAWLLPEPIYWLVVGVALMRTWTHVPTFENEEKFYLSNLWNFPTSEVAWGNLGVAYQNQGLIGSAIDAWYRGTKLNPEYDVSWYNLHSIFKSRGPANPNYAPVLINEIPKDLLARAYQQDPQRSHFHLSAYFLQRALQARTCHFPDPWKKEEEELNRELSRPVGISGLPAVLATPLFTAALT